MLSTIFDYRFNISIHDQSQALKAKKANTNLPPPCFTNFCLLLLYKCVYEKLNKNYFLLI